MKRNPILLIGFTSYTDKGLPSKVSIIINSMDGNTLYTDAGTKLSDVQDAIEKFLAVLGKKGKELNYRTEKGEKRTKLNQALHDLGAYVRDKYPGDADKWLTSGYSVQTFDENTQVPETPVVNKVSDGKLSGSTQLVASRPRYTYVFEGRHWEDGATPPASLTMVSKQSRLIFEGLTPGKTYHFQVRARGTKGVSNWSNAVNWIVR